MSKNKNKSKPEAVIEEIVSCLKDYYNPDTYHVVCKTENGGEFKFGGHFETYLTLEYASQIVKEKNLKEKEKYEVRRNQELLPDICSEFCYHNVPEEIAIILQNSGYLKKKD